MQSLGLLLLHGMTHGAGSCHVALGQHGLCILHDGGSYIMEAALSSLDLTGGDCSVCLVPWVMYWRC